MDGPIRTAPMHGVFTKKPQYGAIDGYTQTEKVL